jgi:hypothetical protein
VNESLKLWVWRASLCWMDVVLICEFTCSRHNSIKGNVFCFGESQQGVTISLVDLHWKYGV